MQCGFLVMTQMDTLVPSLITLESVHFFFSYYNNVHAPKTPAFFFASSLSLRTTLIRPCIFFPNIYDWYCDIARHEQANKLD